MAKMDRFLIAPLNAGLEKDVEPWLISDNAFAELKNAYNFRGKIRKRFGSTLLQGSAAVDPNVAQLLSRLRIQVDTTDGTGAASGTVPGSIFKVGQLFSIGDEIFTVYQTGTPAAMYTTGGGGGTYNTTTGAYVFNGADLNTAVYFYPAEPVMGLLTYERNNINDEILYAFDTQFAYTYASGWDRLGTGIWTGDDADFFWGANYKGANTYDNLLFVSNYVAADGLKYYDGTWNNLVPVINAAGDTVETARIILPFKDRLILLNTVENIAATDRTFAQRCRFSENGNPIDAANGWLEDTPGRGGYIDAPTKEAIISAEFLRDRLIVFFERSTWELVYIGNQALPFTWQKIDTELGAESTFSIVPFDKIVLGVGNIGIHACNGANVERIDNKIPDEVFRIHNENEGVQRVYGVRDYKAEVVYWTFPSQEENTTYPDRVLVFNYKTGTWAINDDTITCFGYFQNPNDITWQSTNLTWEEYTDQWDSGTLQSLFRQVIAGNQEGFTFIVDPGVTSNAASLQITDVSVASNLVTLTIIDHNIHEDDYIYLNFVNGITGLDGNIYKVNTTPSMDSITIIQENVTGTYTGGGTAARITPIDIRTKEFNVYKEQGVNMYMQKIGFYVDRTDNGKCMVDVYTSSSDDTSLVQEGQISGALIGTSVLETSPFATVPYEALQERFWHAVYTQAEGNTVQVRLSLNDEQTRTVSIVHSDFVLNAFMMYVMKTDEYF